MDRALNDFRGKSDGKAYAHFGKRCTLKDDWVWDYVTNPKNIASHKFSHLFHLKRITQNIVIEKRALKKKLVYCVMQHIWIDVSTSIIPFFE